MKDLIAEALLVTGTLFIAIGAIGIVKLPDPLCRSHAISKSLTFGTSLMLLSLWLFIGGALLLVKVVAAILFLFLSIPLAGHLFARYAIEERNKRHGSNEE